MQFIKHLISNIDRWLVQLTFFGYFNEENYIEDVIEDDTEASNPQSWRQQQFLQPRLNDRNEKQWGLLHSIIEMWQARLF